MKRGSLESSTKTCRAGQIGWDRQAWQIAVFIGAVDYPAAAEGRQVHEHVIELIEGREVRIDRFFQVRERQFRGNIAGP